MLEATIGSAWEIIIVDDGGRDFPPESWDADERIRLIRFPKNRGKGAAVKAGMLAATGKTRIYTDVDLPYDPLLIPVATDYLTDGGFHVVLGDRTLPDSRYHMQIGATRRALSKVCSTFVGTLVTGGYFDTQCGFKAFSGEVADRLFPMVHIARFSFDVEVLYLALRFNCAIKRVPVRLRDGGGASTVRLFRDSTRGVFDILRIKRWAMLRRYESAELSRLIEADFGERLLAAKARSTSIAKD